MCRRHQILQPDSVEVEVEVEVEVDRMTFQRAMIFDLIIF